MIKIDPIIAVKDVEASANWYEAVFECKRTHGGDEFAVLLSAEGEVLICLHAWGTHEHPTMTDPAIRAGNGLILYYKTGHPEKVRQNVENLDYPVEEEMHLNPNSKKMEFSIRDPDGYYITVTQFHKYEG